MRAHLAVLVALLLALPCVPAPNVPYDPNTTYLSALSVPLSTSSQEQPDVEFSLTQNGIQYLYFDLPVLTAVTSVAIRVKFSGAKEIHVVAQQGAFSSHCDKPLLPSTSPYSCYSTKMTANTSSSEGTLTLTYPQVDRYFVTVILDSTAEGSGPAQFKVRTTVSACPGSKAGPNCAFPVMSLSEPMDPAVTGYVPANQYKFYVWNQPVSGTFVLHLEAALCADATDTILLFRALNFPSLETSPMFPYYDLSLTCGDAPSELALTAPVGGAYWMAVYGGSKGANFTFGFQASPCGQDVAGSGCTEGEWFPIGQNQGPWCTAAGSSACQEPDTALPWDHALGSSFSLIPPGWNYFTLPELQAPAYTLKVAVTPASRAIPFTLVLIRNNIPVVLPQYTSLPQSAWVYYNTSDAQGSAITTLTVPYPAAGIWMVGILADPNTFGNESIDFSISASHYSCFHNCSTTSGAQLGTCDLTTTQCHCHSGRLGADCSGKAKSHSHAGAIVGAIFGVLGGVVLIGLGVWYFFMRPKNSYEMI